MCRTPRTIFKPLGKAGSGWRPYQVACRHCWQCRENRIWDWVGRGIAENETATKSYFVTLTYGNTNRYGEVLTDRARSLHYEDIQRWLYRIRKKHRVRYIVSGEYGPLKGRAHWHAILFFQGEFAKDSPMRNIKLDFDYWGTSEYNTDPFWKDGKTRWAKFEPRRVKYVCKYMLKAGEEDDSLERHAMLSKKPPLGHHYFMQRAESYVEQGLSPQDLVYHFPEVTWGKQNKKPREYVLQGVSADNFLSHFVEKWRERYGCDSWPYSELLEGYLEAEASERAEAERWSRQAALDANSLEMPWYVPPQAQAFPEELPCKLYVDRRLNLWAISDPSMPERAPRFWSYNEDGFSGWHEKPNLVTEAKAASLRAAYASRLTSPEVALRPRAR